MAVFQLTGCVMEGMIAGMAQTKSSAPTPPYLLRQKLELLLTAVTVKCTPRACRLAKKAATT